MNGFEQLLPACELLAKLVSGGPVRGQDVHVRPVLGELRLEACDTSLQLADPRLDPLQLARPLALLLRTLRRLRLPGDRRRRFRHRVARLLPRANEIRPAAVVGDERPFLDCNGALGDGVEQCTVVRDEQHRPGECLESRFECLTTLQVEVVRRLVQHEQVRARRDDDGKREPAPFAPRQRGHLLLVLGPAGEEKAAEQRLGLRSRQPGHRHRALEHRAALVQLHLVLREIRGLDAMPELDRAAVRFEVPEDRLEQRRLAGAVRADESDMLAPFEDERPTAQELLITRGDRQPLRVENDAARSRRLQELEAEGPPALREARELAGGFLALLLQPPDLCDLRLGLLRLRLLVAEPFDEALEPLDILADAFGCLCRRGRSRRALAPPSVPGPGEEERAAAVELEHRSRHRLEEPAVVRDDHDGRVE